MQHLPYVIGGFFVGLVVEKHHNEYKEAEKAKFIVEERLEFVESLPSPLVDKEQLKEIEESMKHPNVRARDLAHFAPRINKLWADCTSEPSHSK